VDELRTEINELSNVGRETESSKRIHHLRATYERKGRTHKYGECFRETKIEYSNSECVHEALFEDWLRLFYSATLFAFLPQIFVYAGMKGIL
jgi:hypothetical protein